jgi:negative regulator of sigma E activity
MAGKFFKKTEIFCNFAFPAVFDFSAMDNNSSNLSDSFWRRQPTADELRAQPELADEAGLTAALAKVSDVPVPSNFTSRVLDAIGREEKLAARPQHDWNWRWLFPRVAVAAAVLVFAGVSIQRYETSSHRQEIAKSVAMVARANSLPSVDALENLDAIQRMGQSAHADGELLAVLQ